MFRKTLKMRYGYTRVIKIGRQMQGLHAHASKSKETELVKQLKAKIKLSGPLTVAEYMQEVLSNPLVGYYMNKDVFGVQGDFITSPEISQIFGELIGIWFYERWLHYGSPEDFKFVELGPGRGTLVSDILRVFTKLGKISDSLNLHLVEISPAMREIQKKLLCADNRYTIEKTTVGETLRTKDGIPITWHRNILDVPKGFTFYLAHEFFDALPIHQFQRTEHGWREVMVDIDEDINGKLHIANPNPGQRSERNMYKSTFNPRPHHLKFCLAPSNTPATVLIPEDTEGDILEIRPQAQVIGENMAETIQKHGGCSLIVDYGDVKCDRNTLRAFKNHQLSNPLLEPGHSDLTSNLDFLHLEKVFSENGVTTFGPATQRHFLTAMGIDVRKQVLLKKASVEQAKNIESSYKMLTDDSEMGNCFKFFASIHGDKRPPGF